MTIRSEIPVRNELGRLGRSRSVSAPTWRHQELLERSPNKLLRVMLDGDH